MQTIGHRIRTRRRKLGLTLGELAERSGISKPYLCTIETGKSSNVPSDAKLRQIEQILGFSEGDLLAQAHLQRTPTDVRAMLGRLLNPENPVDAKRATGKSAIDFKVLRDAMMMLAPLTGARGARAVPVIAGGSGQLPEIQTNDFVGCPELEDAKAFAARVDGDSMTPKYQDGDVVIFSPALVPRNGDDCFIRFADGRTTFKRIFFEPEANHPMIRLQPRNERYRPTVLKSGDISGMYRAVFRYERLDGQG